MFGESLLVAPIFNKEGNVTYYLPKGIWTNLITNEIVEGERYVTENHGFQTLPLMVKPNTILAMNSKVNTIEYNYIKNVEFHIFELVDNITSSAKVSTISEDKTIIINVIKKNDIIKVTVEGEIENVHIILRNMFSLSNQNKFGVTHAKEGLKIVVEKEMVLKLN